MSVILPRGSSSLSTAVRPDQPRATSIEGRVMAPPQRPAPESSRWLPLGGSWRGGPPPSWPPLDGLHLSPPVGCSWAGHGGGALVLRGPDTGLELTTLCLPVLTGCEV